MKGKNSQIYGSSRVGEISRKRRINCSTSSGPCFDPGGGQKKKERGREKSEAHVVHTGECHVWGPNHKGDKPVTKPPNHNWYNHKKDYNKSVCSDDNIINLVVPQKSARLAKLGSDKEA